MNTKENRRVHYTKAALKRSLLTILKEKSIDKITVKEICQLADLNRGTFYAYYGSPSELLSQIEDEFYVDILASVTAFGEPNDVVTIFTQALTAFKEKSELSSVIFGENGDREFLVKLVNIARPLCLAAWDIISPETPEKDKEMSYDFLSYGCMHVIRRWLQNGMREEPREVAQFLRDISVNGVLDILKVTPEEMGERLRAVRNQTGCN